MHEPTHENTYLVRHVWVHYIKRSQGMEEVVRDRHEKVRLTDEGSAKFAELFDLLLAHKPSWDILSLCAVIVAILLVFLGGGLGYIIGRSADSIFAYVGIPALPFIFAIFWCCATKKAFIAIKDRWDERRAASAAQFAKQNDEFVEALQKIDRNMAQELVRLSILHREQMVA